MDCELINRTLVFRLLFTLSLVGGAIAIFPQIDLGSSASTATRNAFKQGISIQLNAQ